MLDIIRHGCAKANICPKIAAPFGHLDQLRPAPPSRGRVGVDVLVGVDQPHAPGLASVPTGETTFGLQLGVASFCGFFQGFKSTVAFFHGFFQAFDSRP